MRVNVFNAPIDAIDIDEGIKLVHGWAANRQSKTVNFCNVHSVITARESKDFFETLSKGDLNFPDGGPVAAWIKKTNNVHQIRVSGPDFMLKYFQSAKSWSEKVYLYGSTEQVLAELEAKLKKQFPWINIVGSYSPPFKADAEVETQDQIDKINNSGASTLWVSLGCPKQEKWVALHRNKISCPMLAVGAAFPLISGSIPRAPLWMQERSLEWLYRLCKEPKRLFGRYFKTNLKFVLLWIRHA